jgi:NAD(P)-dependent dehydrogenase (short-subunit alcohol dehydrogenase family)
MRVKDKVCVVTGAAGGIGEATARRFARDGAKGVVVADLDAARLGRVAKDIGGLAVTCDVTKEADIQRLIAEAQAKYGPIDVFFSNAGIALAGQEEASDEIWARSWGVHVMSHVYACRVLVPEMLKRGSGYLLSTASAAGLLSSISSAPYTVTKHAAVALAEQMAIQYGDRGIKISVLCPQAVDTNMLRSIASTSARMDGVVSPDEVAECITEAMDKEQFLILPHPVVLDYVRRKTSDWDRWLKGMQRLRERLAQG